MFGRVLWAVAFELPLCCCVAPTARPIHSQLHRIMSTPETSSSKPKTVVVAVGRGDDMTTFEHAAKITTPADRLLFVSAVKENGSRDQFQLRELLSFSFSFFVRCAHMFVVTPAHDVCVCLFVCDALGAPHRASSSSTRPVVARSTDSASSANSFSTSRAPAQRALVAGRLPTRFGACRSLPHRAFHSSCLIQYCALVHVSS